MEITMTKKESKSWIPYTFTEIKELFGKIEVVENKNGNDFAEVLEKEVNGRKRTIYINFCKGWEKCEKDELLCWETPEGNFWVETPEYRASKGIKERNVKVVL